MEDFQEFKKHGIQATGYECSIHRNEDHRDQSSFEYRDWYCLLYIYRIYGNNLSGVHILLCHPISK